MATPRSRYALPFFGSARRIARSLSICCCARETPGIGGGESLGAADGGGVDGVGAKDVEPDVAGVAEELDGTADGPDDGTTDATAADSLGITTAVDVVGGGVTVVCEPQPANITTASAALQQFRLRPTTLRVTITLLHGYGRSGPAAATGCTGSAVPPREPAGNAIEPPATNVFG